MEKYKYSFPFTAITGQESLKEALILCTVNPQIGGVLLCGEKGTGKTTLVRGLSRILDIPFADLPLSITEDALVGTLDLEQTLSGGSPVFQPGLLQKADEGILYADEVNLLPERIVSILLNVKSDGVNRVRREGITHTHPSRFLLVGTMNPEEGKLRGAVLDQFGLYGEAHGETDLKRRVQIMDRRLAYEKDPEGFCKDWAEEEERLRAQILRAQKQISLVTVPEDCLKFAADLVSEGRCEGHRGEILLCETAKAMAAWEDRVLVTGKDIRRAAHFVLPHRIREAVSLQELPQEQPDHGEGEEAASAESMNWNSLPEGSSGENAQASDQQVEMIQPMGQNLSIRIAQNKKLRSLGSGKRLKVRSDTSRGRYVRSRIPVGNTVDLAVDSTIRAAVLSGRNRGKDRIRVLPEDFRQKIREQRTGAVILFLVDASGSMGARKRMGAVKGAVMSLLTSAYEKRDTVGIVAFRGSGAQVLLPFTRSVELAQKKLQSLPTGGKTPLAEGLRTAGQLLRSNQARSPNTAQLLVLVSDGRANAGDTEDPFREAITEARRLSHDPFAFVVLDTEQGFARFQMAKEISDAMGAAYCPLSRITEEEITAVIKGML